MESYLSNRKQYVEIDDSDSGMLDLTSGVPQGSILSPLLFTIYMNDIAQSSKLRDFVIYVDDTTLSTTTNVPINDILNNELSMVNNWLKVNKLSLNIKKSKYIIFLTNKKKIQSLTLAIDNVNIE